MGDRSRLSPRRAVVLARGTGTRMRAADDDARLSPDQHAAAASGHKALMPIGARPFLDYVLQPLAEAGITDVALVVAPDHQEMRAAYPDNAGPSGMALTWIVQSEARGTADAVLAAERWTCGEPFLVINGDNIYPLPALSAVMALNGPGLAGFDRESLIETSNIAADRIAAFALVDAAADGSLARVVEKPTAADIERAGHGLLSMNLWRFDARIFDACRAVPLSPRGELELPAAAMIASSRGVRFTVVPADGPVLDLSRRRDVGEVARRLAGGATLT